MPRAALDPSRISLVVRANHRDLIPAAEADKPNHDECGSVFVSGVGTAWVQDLPLCFPGRDCVDVPPGGAQAMYLISDITAASPGIAAALWTALGISLVLIWHGLRRQWHGRAIQPWLIVIPLVLVVAGAALTWLMNGWLGEAHLVYGGLDGRPAEPVPSSIVSSWPLVQTGAQSAMAVGATALLLMLNTTAVLRRRAARAHESSLR